MRQRLANRRTAYRKNDQRLERIVWIDFYLGPRSGRQEPVRRRRPAQLVPFRKHAHQRASTPQQRGLKEEQDCTTKNDNSRGNEGLFLSSQKLSQYLRSTRSNNESLSGGGGVAEAANTGAPRTDGRVAHRLSYSFATTNLRTPETKKTLHPPRRMYFVRWERLFRMPFPSTRAMQKFGSFHKLTSVTAGTNV